MLNRRFLRVKVLQALYAFFQTSDNDLTVVEKNLFQSIDRLYDLYLYRISLLLSILQAARLNMEKNKAKKLPSEEDLNPNMRFVENKALLILDNNAELKSLLEKKKIDWSVHFDDIKKLWRKIKDSDEYDRYMNQPANDFNIDKKFLNRLYETFIQDETLFEHLLHEQSIYWYTDMEVVDINISKTINGFDDSIKPFHTVVLDLYKDEQDDRKFVQELLRKTILFEAEYNTIISDKTKNWELDRIALMDIIIMKMGFCELEHFENIPVKVTMNEYIELSKNFSTPKSKNFINGILDKVVQEWKAEKRIQKSGRGLVE